jgi:hypothetical protein
MTTKRGATEERLGDLHDEYTTVLEYLLKKAAYKEKEDEFGDSYISVNAKVLDLVAKHLKDNSITSVATVDNPIGRLAQSMAKKQGAKRFGSSVIELKPITKEAVNE